MLYDGKMIVFYFRHFSLTSVCCSSLNGLVFHFMRDVKSVIYTHKKNEKMFKVETN